MKPRWFVGHRHVGAIVAAFQGFRCEGGSIAEVVPIAVALSDPWSLRAGTAAGDGTVRPVRATLRNFGIRASDMYARTFCRGDQPRYIARAAYDFTFRMGLLSTQAIPVTA